MIFGGAAFLVAALVANLAAGGAARLESMFLDEGFGTLDADTLDTVAGAIENLGAGDRMVGIVTHVPELAARCAPRGLRLHVISDRRLRMVTHCGIDADDVQVVSVEIARVAAKPLGSKDCSE